MSRVEKRGPASRGCPRTVPICAIAECPRTPGRCHPVMARSVHSGRARLFLPPVRCDPKHRSFGRQLLALLHGGVPTKPQMRPASGGDSCETADDRSPIRYVHLFQCHGCPSATAKDSGTTGGSHVLDPVGSFTEHRHQVLAAFPVGYDDGEGDDLAAAAASHLQAGRPPRARGPPRKGDSTAGSEAGPPS